METFFSMDGRIGRLTFWVGNFVLVAAAALPIIVMGALGISPEDDPLFNEMMSGSPTSTVALVILFMLFTWPSICLTGKRFHDRNKSAWWYMIGFVPIIGGIWILIECGFLKGTEGSNAYGPDPVD